MGGTSTRSVQDCQEAGNVFGEQPGLGTPADIFHIRCQHLWNILAPVGGCSSLSSTSVILKPETYPLHVSLPLPAPIHR